MLQKLFEDIQRRKAAKPQPDAEPVVQQPPPSPSELTAQQQAGGVALESEVLGPSVAVLGSRQPDSPDYSADMSTQPDNHASVSLPTADNASGSAAKDASPVSLSAPRLAVDGLDGTSQPGGGLEALTPQTDLGRQDTAVAPSSLPATDDPAGSHQVP